MGAFARFSEMRVLKKSPSSSRDYSDEIETAGKFINAQYRILTRIDQVTCEEPQVKLISGVVLRDIATVSSNI